MTKAAESLQRWEPGQIIYVDRGGKVLSSRGVWRQRLKFLLPLGAIVSVLVVQQPLAGLAGLAAGLLTFAVRRRQMRPFQQATELLANDRRDEARALLARLDAKPLQGYHRFIVDRSLGALEWADGHFDAALDRLGRAAAVPTGSANLRLLIALTAAYRVECLAAAGRIDEAKAARATVPPGQGELFVMNLRDADLAIAFNADDDTILPDDATLYDWAKAVLATNRFGPSALMLAWAFERRGDAEMARHLIDEAPARMFGWTIERSMPKLHAWAATRTPPPPPEPLP